MAEKEQEKNQFVKQVAEQKYEFGFTTDVHTEIIEKGLNEDVVRLISQKKGEPDWMLEFRLKAYNYWKTLKEPKWGHVHVPPIDYQEISYYADPLAKKPKNKEIDPELEKTFDKLGIPLEERLALSGTAVDAIMDSVSVKTTFKEKLREKGVIFCSIGEAVKEHPDLVREYLGTVVPYRDNFYAALNSCVFSDGSFVYIPKGVRCPMELSSYFRINARNTGQFERTLIIADDDAYVSYLEGCTAPMRDENQLHAAIVEIIVKDNAEVKYSTVQNWYPGDEHGKGGVLNLVTKRGDLRGVNSKLSWTQVETGSAITWKYPSCILRGDNSVAEFYSVAVTNNYQEADTGTKMIHMGKNTKSTIISKGISAGHSQNSYRGLVRATSNADNARNYSSCDSLLLGSDCGAHTFPYMDAHNDTAVFEHEATTSKISEDQLFYCNQLGDDYKFVQNAVKNYDSMKPMILDGDQYRLVSPYEGNHCAINYVSKDKQRAVLFAYDLHPRYKEPVMNVKMQGLDADKVYTVKETNLMPGKESDLECNGKQYSGDYLMKVGLNVFSQTDGTSHVLVLE